MGVKSLLLRQFLPQNLLAFIIMKNPRLFQVLASCQEAHLKTSIEEFKLKYHLSPEYTITPIIGKITTNKLQLKITQSAQSIPKSTHAVTCRSKSPLNRFKFLHGSNQLNSNPISSTLSCITLMLRNIQRKWSKLQRLRGMTLSLQLNSSREHQL